MKSQLVIGGPIYKYKYLIEYNKSNIITNSYSIVWSKNNNDIKLFGDNIQYYRKFNEWYSKNTITDYQMEYIPNDVKKTNIKLYIPDFAAHRHANGVKYMVSFNTYINGIKIDLGSFLFRPTDTKAIESGPIKTGNTEYFEYISFDLLDPYYIMYSDNWIDFRKNVCDEKENINSTPSSLYVSFYIVNEYDNKFIMNNEFIGSCNNFIVSDNSDFTSAKLSIVNEDKLGFKFDIDFNSEYDWLLSYISETYNIRNASLRNVKLDVAIKNKNSIIEGPVHNVKASYDFGHIEQCIYWNPNLMESFRLFFSSWNDYEEGWSFIGSMTIYDDNNVYEDPNMVETFITNEIPITQELYSLFVNGGSEKIDISNLHFENYNIVNKIEHSIEYINRPISNISNKEITPARIKRPDKFSIHKTFVKPLIKLNN